MRKTIETWIRRFLDWPHGGDQKVELLTLWYRNQPERPWREPEDLGTLRILPAEER